SLHMFSWPECMGGAVRSLSLSSTEVRPFRPPAKTRKPILIATLPPDYESTMTPRNLLLVRGFSTLRSSETGWVLQFRLTQAPRKSHASMAGPRPPLGDINRGGLGRMAISPRKRVNALGSGHGCAKPPRIYRSA